MLRSLLVLVVAVMGMALGARESYTYASGLTVTITKRVPAQNCTIWSQNGDTMQVYYVGTLEDGTVFDTNYPKNQRQPWSFVLGSGYAIAGYDQGLGGMCVGEIRSLQVPPALGYGSWGFPAIGIPGNADLYFQTELVAINRPQPAATNPAKNNVK
jgi:FK506-binding protein 2